jgi:hypothetical protein
LQRVTVEVTLGSTTGVVDPGTEASMSRSRLVVAAGMAWLIAAAAGAADGLPERLARDLAATLPQGWQVRASWRDRLLVAFVSPPIHQGFDMVYQPERRRMALREVCAAIGPAIWEELGPAQAIAVEPVVGGKGNAQLRERCVAPPPR